MTRVPDLVRFCSRHDLAMITIADLARYRFESECDGALDAIEASFAPV